MWHWPHVGPRGLEQVSSDVQKVKCARAWWAYKHNRSWHKLERGKEKREEFRHTSLFPTHKMIHACMKQPLKNIYIKDGLLALDSRIKPRAALNSVWDLLNSYVPQIRMESLDELEHPLLDDSPTNSSRMDNSGLFKGIFVRCEDEKRPPSLAWRSCSGPKDISQQQLLDPCSLPSTLESFYTSSAPIWGPADSLGLHSKEYLETTFMDIGPGSPLERKLLAVSRDIHSVSYSMEDEDNLLPDFEVRFKCLILSLCLYTSLFLSLS